MKIRIFLKAYNKELLNLVCENLSKYLVDKECNISGIIALPIKIKRFCVLRSPHKYNDSREHFEIKLMKRFLDVNFTSKDIINSLLELEFPSGISCSIKFI